MKRNLIRFLLLTVLLSMLAGCTGTVVVIEECTCSVGGTSSEQNTPVVPPAEGALKTGLAIAADISGSENAVKANFDVTVAAVLVDDDGIIRDCILDSLGTTVSFDGTGTLTSDPAAALLTKNELGADYGMVAWGGAIAEWDEQAAALAAYAVGRTADELRNGAVDETGYAPAGSDLASSATIYLGGYVEVIAAAAENAVHLGAAAGDALHLAVNASAASSTSASADAEGLAQLDCDVTALTDRGGVITGCAIDSLQAKVNFDASGTITTDLTVPLLTKNQLGENYGMVAWGGAIAEWDEQAAAFAAYVTGKTADEVAGIAVSEGKPAEADLVSSVTIAIGGFQALIAKAMTE
ncbi:MAG: hypothetical protein IJ302_06560 [Clostridia bacterium]|nr:hypothetical protein [Clostridia bacterium]